MSYNNGIISAPVETSDPYYVMGVDPYYGNYDLVYISSNQHNKMNIYNMYKPVLINKIEELTDNDFKNACYGFVVNNSNLPIENQVYIYKSVYPDGWSRITDFIGYNQQCKNFADISLPYSMASDSINPMKIGSDFRWKTSNGILGISDIYPQEIKCWGVKLTFKKSKKTFYQTYTFTDKYSEKVFPILLLTLREFIDWNTDGTTFQLTQFMSTQDSAGRNGKWTTISPENVNPPGKLYPLINHSGQILSKEYSVEPFKVGDYRPNDGITFVHLIKSVGSIPLLYTTLVKDVAGIGLGRFKSLDAYYVIFNITYGYITYIRQAIDSNASYYDSAHNIYNFNMSIGYTASAGISHIQVFIVDRGSTNGEWYMTLEVEHRKTNY